MKELEIKGRRVRVVKGDITTYEGEAIVNAANNRLLMGGGVAGAIKRKGGKVIEEEAVRKGPIPVGSAVETSAGNLRARYVIHAAVMGMDFKTDGEKIRKATRSSLEKAKELGIKSIAFPALGTGVGGFPLKEAGKIMWEEVKKHLEGDTTLEEVVFYLYTPEAYEEFSKALEEGSNGT